MSDENDSWLSGIGIDVKGILGTVQEKGAAVLDEVKSKGAAAFEEAKGAVSTATAAVTGGAPPLKPAAAPAPKPAAPTRAPSANGSSVSSLKGSVGAGGKNNPDDVKAVQTALKIAADGKCGPATIAAIKAFQTSIGQAKPDGRVDAGGATSRALAGRGGGAPPAPTPAPAVAPTPATDDAEEGFFDGLKKKIGDRLGDAAGAVKDIGGKIVKGAGDLAGDANVSIPGAAGGSGGASPALANLTSGIGIPKLSLDDLSKEQTDAARKFLTAHLTAGWKGFGSPEDPANYIITLKGKNATIDEVVQALKAEIPSRVLQNLSAEKPTADLKALVQVRIRELVAPLVVAANKTANERRKFVLPDGSVAPNVPREFAKQELIVFLKKVLKAQGGTALSVTAPVRLAGRAIAKGTGPGPTFLEGQGRFPGTPEDLAAAIVKVLPPLIPRGNLEALDRIPVKDVTSTQPPNVAAALASVVKKEVDAIVKLFPKSIQDDIRNAIPDLIAAGIAALVEHGMQDSALKDRLDDNAKKIIKAIVEASSKQSPGASSFDRQQDTAGSPDARDQPPPRDPSQPEQPAITDEKVVKTPAIKTPDGPPPKPGRPETPADSGPNKPFIGPPKPEKP